MSSTLRSKAHAVLLPAFATLQMSDSVKKLLSCGGCSILLGETREEYVAREMTPERRREEKPGDILELVEEARALSGELLVAVDQEISGICRLHNLVPPFPAGDRLTEMSTAKFEKVTANIAREAKKLGVNCFLGPILDVVTGANPWLQNRTWSENPEEIARISSAYIRAVQAHGIAATAKHFPGYSIIDRDPAVDPGARNVESLESVRKGEAPFIDAIANDVEIIMAGPAIVEAYDPLNGASVSPSVIRRLREGLGFKGIVMSDDLDAKAILRGHSITQIAVEALRAGADYLLVADTSDQIDQIVSAIVSAVESGGLDKRRLDEAAGKVRSLAKRYCQ